MNIGALAHEVQEARVLVGDSPARARGRITEIRDQGLDYEQAVMAYIAECEGAMQDDIRAEMNAADLDVQPVEWAL